MQVIDTKNAPGAIGPYSQGFKVGGFVYTSGQIPVDPATGNAPEGIVAQAEHMGDFAAFNEVYAKYFTSKPARSCVAVKSLPKGLLCEIEAIAEQ